MSDSKPNLRLGRLENQEARKSDNPAILVDMAACFTYAPANISAFFPQGSSQTAASLDEAIALARSYVSTTHSFE